MVIFNRLSYILSSLFTRGYVVHALKFDFPSSHPRTFLLQVWDHIAKTENSHCRLTFCDSDDPTLQLKNPRSPGAVVAGAWGRVGAWERGARAPSAVWKYCPAHRFHSVHKILERNSLSQLHWLETKHCGSIQPSLLSLLSLSISLSFFLCFFLSSVRKIGTFAS